MPEMCAHLRWIIKAPDSLIKGVRLQKVRKAVDTLYVMMSSCIISNHFSNDFPLMATLRLIDKHRKYPWT